MRQQERQREFGRVIATATLGEFQEDGESAGTRRTQAPTTYNLRQPFRAYLNTIDNTPGMRPLAHSVWDCAEADAVAKLMHTLLAKAKTPDYSKLMIRTRGDTTTIMTACKNCQTWLVKKGNFWVLKDELVERLAEKQSRTPPSLASLNHFPPLGQGPSKST